jgi:hypothetical protein
MGEHAEISKRFGAKINQKFYDELTSPSSPLWDNPL